MINIQDSALKSLLAAKSIQADEHDVAVTLEVPEVVKLQDMELIDFITIVSILFDNALEAAVDTSSPKVNVAFLNIGDKQMFIIENSIKEETINISEVYSFGHSSKGSDRGIGLYNVMKIIERYPNVSLNTRSQCHVFGQMLEIGKNK
ncbi:MULTISPECIES: GHKL domain-containing protein [Streptococcus]|uniref:GHKL domain-containing protein n=1 Tax=Streptococcus TaxID=1301 RepID=UPI001D14E1FF|nr:MULTISPECIES: GHKL domain-containing protein [Streptococcus]